MAGRILRAVRMIWRRFDRCEACGASLGENYERCETCYEAKMHQEMSF